MKTYKGKIEIRCTKKSGCLQKLKDAQPSCMSCPEAVSVVVDLDGKTLFESKALEVKQTGKKKK